ncbi:MAG: Crp/Fnr family transcriptional regulator [Ignavibacteriaceae bacterium]
MNEEISQFLKIIFSDGKIMNDKNDQYLKQISVPPKTILLKEGEISHKMYFIKQGCIRMGFHHDGRDITFQFFFENQSVSSIESFISDQPSEFFIETIEPSTVYVVTKTDFWKIINDVPEISQHMQKMLMQRMGHYARLFLSFIRDTPAERYKQLLENQPHIIQRVPQHYIASYLGITSVSLSRIRNRLLKDKK